MLSQWMHLPTPFPIGPADCMNGHQLRVLTRALRIPRITLITKRKETMQPQLTPGVYAQRYNKAHRCNDVAQRAHKIVVRPTVARMPICGVFESRLCSVIMIPCGFNARHASVTLAAARAFPRCGAQLSVIADPLAGMQSLRFRPPAPTLASSVVVLSLSACLRTCNIWRGHVGSNMGVEAVYPGPRECCTLPR
jgi:hypothetical protein